MVTADAYTESSLGTEAFNTMSPNDTAHYWEDDLSRMLYAVPCTLFMIVGTVGNILSFIVFSSKAMKQSVTSVYFRVLAVSDTVVLFSGGVVFFVLGVFGVDIRAESQAACKFWIPLLQVACFHSCWILVFIAVDRFIGVYFPHKYRQLCTKKRALVAMGGWCLVVLVLVGAFYATVFTLEDNQCGIAAQYQWFHDNVYRWFNLVVLNLIPSAVLVSLNVAILVKIIKASDSRNITSDSQKSDSGKSSKSSKVASPTLILLSVSLVYMLCTIPTSTAFLVIQNFTGPRAAAQVTLYIRCCETLYLLNHTVNFFLYCLHGTSFRRELRALCRKRAGDRLVPSHSHSNTTSQTHSTQLSTYKKTYSPKY